MDTDLRRKIEKLSEKLPTLEQPDKQHVKRLQDHAVATAKAKYPLKLGLKDLVKLDFLFRKHCH